jgi:hypothetical protein
MVSVYKAVFQNDCLFLHTWSINDEDNEDGCKFVTVLVCHSCSEHAAH